jgi:excisionase family DNA binding protein
MTNPKALSVSDACDMLGISSSTLYRMFDRGEIARRKIGHRTMVSLKDVRALIDGNEKVAA